MTEKFRQLREQQDTAWTPKNEIDYINLLNNDKFVEKLFHGYVEPPTKERLLRNYRLSFARRYKNRTFDGWTDADYDELWRHIERIMEG